MTKTYRQAGVDLDKEVSSIGALVSELKYRREGLGRMLTDIGHFTGLVEFGDWALSLCADGVGTKMLVAEAMGKWDTVGIDCMAMNVNDMICIGAEPIAFVDYLAVDKYDEDAARQIGIGLNEGARQANVSIIGGEFATLPEIVKGFDLAGVCLGAVKKDRIITGGDIKPGNAIIGLGSDGIHSNGLTLARKVLAPGERGYEAKLPGTKETVGSALLTPTRIYVREVLELLGRFKLKGMVHVTGGGLRNIVRVNKSVSYEIDAPFEPQPVFKAIQKAGSIDDREMYQTFNMGMGFCIISEERDVDPILESLKGKVEARLVGRVAKGAGVTLPRLGLRYERY